MFQQLFWPRFVDSQKLGPEHDQHLILLKVTQAILHLGSQSSIFICAQILHTWLCWAFVNQCWHRNFYYSNSNFMIVQCSILVQSMIWNKPKNKYKNDVNWYFIIELKNTLSSNSDKSTAPILGWESSWEHISIPSNTSKYFWKKEYVY